MCGGREQVSSRRAQSVHFIAHLFGGIIVKAVQLAADVIGKNKRTGRVKVGERGERTRTRASARRSWACAVSRALTST